MSTLFKYIKTALIFGLLSYMQAHLRSALSLFSSVSKTKMPNLLTATASDIQHLLTTRELQSVDVLQAYLDQIDKHEGYLNAIITQPSRSWLRETARVLDEERSANKVRGPLHGIPVLLKDNMATSEDLEMGTTAGSLALVGSKPRKNALVVEKLIKAGAIIIGKANLSELNFFKGAKLDCGWSAVGGQTQSAYVRGGFRMDDSFAGHSNPAGSSTGSAVGVTAAYAPVALGTETEGSLIVPSSRGALYTLKPTISIVSQEGVVPITGLFDAVGPMTKSVKDLATMLDVLVEPNLTEIPQGGYVSAVTGSWKGLRIGSLDPDIWEFPESARKKVPSAEKQMKEEIVGAYKKIKTLAESFHENVPLISSKEFEFNGAHVIPTLCAQMFPAAFKEYLSMVDNCKVSSVEELIKFNDDNAEKELPPRNPRQTFLEDAAKSNLTEDETQAFINHARSVARARGIDKIFRDLDINIIVGPAESAITQFSTAAGYPIASLPVGYLDFNGRPHGLAAIAAAHQEATLIQLQSAWEASNEPRLPPPLLEGTSQETSNP